MTASRFVEVIAEELNCFKENAYLANVRCELLTFVTACTHE